MLTSEEKAQLADPAWRFRNLYSIVTDDGLEMRFTPNPEQLDFVDHLWFRNLVLKARQLGFTTAIDILGLDQCLFNDNFTTVIICDSLPNAEKIFRNKVKRVYERLPKLVRDLAPIERETTSELIFTNGSSISVTTSARSGTVNFLHVSEMGKIARKYPEKAREIITGSFEAVPKDGMIIVESTAEGNSGWFHDACIEGHKRAVQGSHETQLDWRLHFYPWWKKPDYTLPAEGISLTDSQRDYFSKLAPKVKHTFTPEQKAWYVKKSATLTDDMKREYPATVEEAFQQSTDGMIYGKEMMFLRELGRIGKVPYRKGIVVNTFWDLGVNDINAIWLHQRVGAMNRFIKYIWASNEGIGYYWRELEKWREEMEAKWGKHYLPHDGDARIQGYEVMTRKGILEEAGARNIEIVPRISDIRTGIDLTKRMFSECEIDEDGCADGIKALDNYSREWDDKRQTWASHPRHDWASNGSDAFRGFAQAFNPEGDRPRPETAEVRYGRGGY